ncbi:MAG: cycloisomerase [Phyllobacterium sp.]|uniref:cycloisomerase n=1 Tax=Phyllobacterium sp. TaxID=1871046 RepID=UPI0030F32FDA
MAESGCKCGFAMVHGSLSKFRQYFRGLARAVIAGLSLATSDNAGEAISGADAAAPVLNAREVRRFPVPDAFQGVAVNAHAFYAISNTQITKYDKASGRRLANWSDPSGDIVHLNSCAIRKAILVCAHSNYPDSPARSSIEIFDTATLKHVGHRSLGITPGALTWAAWHEGAWWLCYATYGGFAQDPYKAGSSTTIVRYDERWRRRRRETWLFPTSVLNSFGAMSASGGAWGPGHYLYVTGHDRPELYVLRLPESGSVLRHVATIIIPGHGQAFGWDPTQPRILYSIDRALRAIIVVRVPPIPTQEQ